MESSGALDIVKPHKKWRNSSIKQLQRIENKMRSFFSIKWTKFFNGKNDPTNERSKCVRNNLEATLQTGFFGRLQNANPANQITNTKTRGAPLYFSFPKSIAISVPLRGDLIVMWE